MMSATVPDGPLCIFPLYGIHTSTAGTPSCMCAAGAKCKDVGKHPMVRWREYDGNERGPDGGYGIPTGVRNGIFVIDLDRRPAKGDKPAKDGVGSFLAAANGRPIPDTASVLTPSGGVHLYYRLPPGFFVPNKRALFEGVDVRGEGGYVVGPGSPHKNGGTYQEVSETLTDAPAWLLELVSAPLEGDKPVTVHRTIEPTSPEGVRAIAWAKVLLASAEPAIEGQGGSDRLFAVACRLMYSALPLDVLQELVEEVYNPRCDPPWSQREIEHKLEDADEVFEEPRGLASPDFLLKLAGRTTQTGVREPDPLHEYTFEPGMRSCAPVQKTSLGEITGDLFDHVDWAGVLMFDTFRCRVIAVDPPVKLDAETKGLSDNDVTLVQCWLEHHGKTTSLDNVRRAIEAVAYRRAFDPRQDWLKSLVWDQKPRLTRVLPDYFQTAAGAYELGIGPRWFISLVARAMTPGCQSDCTLILEGIQGIGKTRAFRALMPDPSWYAETTSGVEAKDFLENLRGVWLMAFDELDSLTRASLTKVKTVLTSTRDRYRKSFGHYADDYPRTCGFCGSTNQETYFNDATGGRRFWPVAVLAPILVAKILDDLEQLWAEAYARWKAGEPWHVNTPELRETCEEQQEARLEADPWEKHVIDWLNDPAKVSFKPLPKPIETVFKGGLRVYDASQGVTTEAVLTLAIDKPRPQQSNGDNQRVGRILRHLGMTRTRVRIGGVLGWYYLPKK
jgi:predicted P-loop ATPase